MYWDVTSVKPLPDYKIYVELKNGSHGIFDVKPYLDKGVFQELKNVNYFKQVGILFGAVTWPHGQDIAPETLIAEMQPIDVETLRLLMSEDQEDMAVFAARAHEPTISYEELRNDLKQDGKIITT